MTRSLFYRMRAWQTWHFYLRVPERPVTTTVDEVFYGGTLLRLYFSVNYFVVMMSMTAELIFAHC